MSAGECRKKLTIFSKNAEGSTDTAQKGHMDCQGQVSETFCCLSLKMGLSAGPCEDPSAAVTQRLKGTLHASLEVIRDRKSLRGWFSGNWQLLHGNTALAAGKMCGTVGAGTHRSPAAPQDCEPCSVPDHYEGTFTGQVLLPGEFLGAEICATLAGMGPLVTSSPQRMAIEGVLISCCPD
jgi:hypothetical protein